VPEAVATGRRRPRARLRRGPLPAPLAADFESWLEKVRARYLPPLTPRELHAGVRALSSRYVERRGEGAGPARALDGLGKRAAFASYYAPLHFLAAHHALVEVFAGELADVRRLVDLGCGSAAVGAAAARAAADLAAEPPRLLGIDASGWALSEARSTLACLGVAGRLRRGRLPAALPRGAEGELWLLGWTLNELAPDERDALRAGIERGLRRGVRVLVLEPLAGSISPWWAEWRDALAPLGIADDELRVHPALPARLAEIDRATGLRHAEIGARLLHGPHP
jgi:hypothetical protein